MTIGPWRPISLHTYEARLVDVRVSARVHTQLSADLDVSFSLSKESAYLADVVLNGPSGSAVVGQSGIKVERSKAHASFCFAKGEVELWYPVGYGSQPIYEVQVIVMDQVSRGSSLLYTSV
jgi:beta-mannosidase